MTKAHQMAFNKALIATLKSKNRRMILSKDKKRYEVVVPVATIIKNFKPFMAKVNKDLGLVKSKTKK